MTLATAWSPQIFSALLLLWPNTFSTGSLHSFLLISVLVTAVLVVLRQGWPLSAPPALVPRTPSPPARALTSHREPGLSRDSRRSGRAGPVKPEWKHRVCCDTASREEVIVFQPEKKGFVWGNQPSEQNLTEVLVQLLLSQQKIDQRIQCFHHHPDA